MIGRRAVITCNRFRCGVSALRRASCDDAHLSPPRDDASCALGRPSALYLFAGGDFAHILMRR